MLYIYFNLFILIDFLTFLFIYPILTMRPKIKPSPFVCLTCVIVNIFYYKPFVSICFNIFSNDKFQREVFFHAKLFLLNSQLLYCIPYLLTSQYVNSKQFFLIFNSYTLPKQYLSKYFTINSNI